MLIIVGSPRSDMDGEVDGDYGVVVWSMYYMVIDGLGRESGDDEGGTFHKGVSLYYLDSDVGREIFSSYHMECTKSRGAKF
jgi:hypothetical protein